MPIEPVQIRETLKQHHVRGLSEHQQRLLTARVHGCSNKDCAEAFGFSEPRVRAHFDGVEDLIAVPLGYRRDLAVTVLWFVYHLQCCLPTAKALLETSSVFQSGNR
jgi:hypothetical protein